ncbi:hypothetical protein BDF22DRAFT_740785 [Syncephalis plumigaleata]|nr:hypothetical protein BDF22DRAFT_740785 [Syncephalis plumigaleata]
MSYCSSLTDATPNLPAFPQGVNIEQYTEFLERYSDYRIIKNIPQNREGLSIIRARPIREATDKEDIYMTCGRKRNPQPTLLFYREMMRRKSSLAQQNLDKFVNIPSSNFLTENLNCFITSARCDRTIGDYVESDEYRVNGRSRYLSLISTINDGM